MLVTYSQQVFLDNVVMETADASFIKWVTLKKVLKVSIFFTPRKTELSEIV